MLQSVTESNKFVFIHYYNNPKQYETPNNVFSQEVAEKLGLEFCIHQSELQNPPFEKPPLCFISLIKVKWKK